MKSFTYRRRVVLGLAVIAGLMAMSGATAQGAQSHNKAQPARDNLTLAYTVSTPNLTDVGIFLARDKRIFAKYGINLRIIMLNGDTLGLQALIGGSADVAWISNQLLYTAIAQEADIQGFLENDPVQDYELVSNNKVAGITDMPGHVLATSGPGGIAEVLPFLAMRKAGVDTSKVKTVNAGGSSGRINALAAGRADAGIVHVFDAVQFLAKNPGGKFKILQNLGKTLPDFQFVVFAAKKSTLKSKHDVLVRFTRALMEAQRKIQDRQTAINEFRAYFPAANPYQTKLAYNIVKGIGSYAIDGGMTQKAFNFTVNSLLEEHLLAKPVTYAQAYDTSIRDAALKFFPPVKKK